jgi:hypothetical protein
MNIASAPGQILSSDILWWMPLVADRGWGVYPATRYIRDAQGYCPLCALAETICGPLPGFPNRTDFNGALERMGIGWYFSGMHGTSIARAADQPGHYLRNELLKALGLEAGL